MNTKKSAKKGVRKQTIVMRILIIELVTSIILCGILIAVLPYIFYSAVSAQALKSAEVIGEQALEGIDSLMKELYFYTRYINSDSNFRRLLYQRDDPEVADELQNALSNMYFFNNNLVISGMIVYEDGKIIKSYGVAENDINQLETPWYAEIGENNYTNQFNIEYNDEGEAIKLYYVQHFDNLRGGGANVFLSCTFLPFQQYLDAIEASGGSYTILDRNLDVQYPKDYSMEWSETIKTKITSSTIYNKDVIENSNGVNIVYKTGLGGGYLLINMSKDTLLEPYQDTIQAIMIVFILFFLVLQMIIIFVLVRSLHPINSLARAMQKVAAGDLSVRASINSGDEIEMLGNNFNNMTAELKKNLDMLFQKERIQQKMKYSLLISQIDPHFIYNTMNTITYLANHGRNEDVVIVNRMLIHILKDTLRVRGIDFYDTLGTEIEIVDSYITIQRYRYGDCFDMKWEIPDDMTDVLIAKNIIQPIVENALFHGLLTNKDEDGEIIGGVIKVSAQRSGEYIVISVSDSGRGIDRDKAEAFNKGEKVFDANRGEHIGISNIYERLKYLYNDDFEMKIEAAKEGGTRVIINYREMSNIAQE